MKNKYFIDNVNMIISLENKGKYYAYALKEYSNYNLYYTIKNIKALKTVNICKSYNKAKELANIWNESYKNNNTLMTINELKEII